MANVEELAKNPQPTIDSYKKIESGLHEADPQKTYDGVARLIVTMIGGPYVMHDASLEEWNRLAFLQSLERSIDSLAVGDGEMAAAQGMSAWKKRWEGVDSSIGQKNLIPEDLMPVAMLAVDAVQNTKGDSTVFISLRFKEKRIAAIKDYLQWAHKAIASKVVDPREFFGQGKMFNFLPYRSLSREFYILQF